MPKHVSMNAILISRSTTEGQVIADAFSDRKIIAADTINRAHEHNFIRPKPANGHVPPAGRSGGAPKDD